jgi:hypothetical protein
VGVAFETATAPILGKDRGRVTKPAMCKPSPRNAAFAQPQAECQPLVEIAMAGFLQFSHDEAAEKLASMVRYASWAEIAAWARERGLKFDGNVEPLNRTRKKEGKKPFVLMAGRLWGLRR